MTRAMINQETVSINKKENTHDTYVDEQIKKIDRSFPAKGKDVEQLLEFIEIESPLDEYLRERRDMERELMFIKERINESLTTIKETLEWIDYAFIRIDKAYKKQVDNGSSEKDNIH